MKAWTLALLVVCSLLSGGLAAEPLPLRIGVIDDAQLVGTTQRVLREAYARAGQQNIRFIALPLRRAALMLHQGELDGDSMRTHAFFDANPAVLRIKVPMRNMTFWAHSKPPCVQTVSPEELARSQVSYQTGSVLLEALLPQSARVSTTSIADALQRVRMGSANYSLLPMTPGMTAAVERRFPDICRVRLPVLTVDLFHALAPHQASLLPSLEAAFLSMRRDGTLARIWAEGEPHLEAWHADPEIARSLKKRS